MKTSCKNCKYYHVEFVPNLEGDGTLKEVLCLKGRNIHDDDCEGYVEYQIIP